MWLKQSALSLKLRQLSYTVLIVMASVSWVWQRTPVRPWRVLECNLLWPCYVIYHVHLLQRWCIIRANDLVRRRRMWWPRYNLHNDIICWRVWRYSRDLLHTWRSRLETTEWQLQQLQHAQTPYYRNCNLCYYLSSSTLLLVLIYIIFLPFWIF